MHTGAMHSGAMHSGAIKTEDTAIFALNPDSKLTCNQGWRMQPGGCVIAWYGASWASRARPHALQAAAHLIAVSIRVTISIVWLGSRKSNVLRGHYYRTARNYLNPQELYWSAATVAWLVGHGKTRWRRAAIVFISQPTHRCFTSELVLAQEYRLATIGLERCGSCFAHDKL